jgi:hypothetical protein
MPRDKFLAGNRAIKSLVNEGSTFLEALERYITDKGEDANIWFEDLYKKTKPLAENYKKLPDAADKILSLNEVLDEMRKEAARQEVKIIGLGEEQLKIVNELCCDGIETIENKQAEKKAAIKASLFTGDPIKKFFADIYKDSAYDYKVGDRSNPEFMEAIGVIRELYSKNIDGQPNVKDANGNLVKNGEIDQHYIFASRAAFSLGCEDIEISKSSDGKCIDEVSLTCAGNVITFETSMCKEEGKNSPTGSLAPTKPVQKTGSKTK